MKTTIQVYRSSVPWEIFASPPGMSMIPLCISLTDKKQVAEYTFLVSNFVKATKIPGALSVFFCKENGLEGYQAVVTLFTY